jgi:hypothetical protein
MAGPVEEDWETRGFERPSDSAREEVRRYRTTLRFRLPVRSRRKCQQRFSFGDKHSALAGLSCFAHAPAAAADYSGSDNSVTAIGVVDRVTKRKELPS